MKNIISLDNRHTLDGMLKRGELLDLHDVAGITGFCVRYVRQLCRTRKVDHHRFLSRYYMTKTEVAALLQPVKKSA